MIFINATLACGLAIFDSKYLCFSLGSGFSFAQQDQPFIGGTLA